MSGFRSVSEIAAAIDAGQHHITTWRKQPAVTGGGGGGHFDLSMVPGNPTPNYYASAPAVAAALSRSGNGGINHGPNPPDGMNKYLFKSMLLQTSSVNGNLFRALLCDYLLYYPFIDSSDPSEQLMDNTVGLSRCTDGEGVQIVPITVAPFGGYTLFTCSYTNQDGVSGRTTRATRGYVANQNGMVLCNSYGANLAGFVGPFMALQAGDTGVRRIDSVTFSTNDVGLVCFVLVKPIANAGCIYELTAPVERTFPVDFPIMPKIENDAYLNHLICGAGSSYAQPYHGLMEFIWN